MQHLYFCRHGESELNAERIFSGQTDTPLTEKGRAEARQAGEQAKTMHFDLIVASPLSRALETAQIIAAKIGYPLNKIIVDDIFIERSLGSLEGKSWDEYDETADAGNGAETEAALRARAQAGLQFLQSLPKTNILLVGHGSFSRELRAAFHPGETYGEPPNAQIIQLL